MTRVLTAVFGILLILALTVWGPAWAFAGLVLLVAALGLDEFLGMAAARGLRRPGRWWLLPGVAVTLSFRFGPEWTLGFLVAGLLLLSIVSIGSGRGTEHLEYFAFGMTGVVYACILPGFLLLMTPEVLWVLIGTVWAGDTAAYYGGRLLGRHRLAPVVSPNKTVEGAISGGLASVIVGGLLGSLFLSTGPVVLAGICLVTGVVGQLGDLAESAMKRTAGLKDTANRLPGHGGILDRVDSLLFAGPVFHLLMVWAA